ncbi:MAG: response regulator [Candidatus Solibacter usitatus]|nr:response regulator [Candidatus Solibacter usitatus]
MSDLPPGNDSEMLRCQVGYLEQLLEVEEQTIVEQSARLEKTLAELQLEREALRKSEERMRSIVNSALDGIITIDGEGVILDWNPAAEKILGWTREEAQGNSLEGLIGGTGQMNRRVELNARHRDGREVPVELSIAPARSREDLIFSCFLRDISARKQTEQLTRAREQAEIALRLKSEFLAAMSHEIRTPMNGVTGMAELLLATGLNAEQQDYAQTILSSADALLTILNGILDFSKIETGKLELERIAFDLREVVEESAYLLAPKAAQKNLEFIVDYPMETPCLFLGDPGRVRQVLTNLMGNAIKFTAAGQVSIRVACEERSAEGAQMVVAVEDTGIGIAADQFDNIFEQFTQADLSTTRKFGGTGLGLSISKRLAEIMGGSLKVGSRIGVGSTFCFHVPFARQTTSKQSAVDMAGVRALVVDDNPASLRVLALRLSSLGIIANGASSGREALQALRQALHSHVPFDLVLIDESMPEMSGEELGRAIHSDGKLRGTQLVLLTTASGGLGQRLHPGFSAVVVKPVRQAHLLRALAAAAGTSRSLASLGESLRPAAAASQRNARRMSARVLLAEDNAVNQRVATAMLEKLGCTVDHASDGKQAVQMAQTLLYDLVLMDCQMPIMDGWEATAQIRRGTGPASRTPIIALTASAMKEDRERCLAAGMDWFLSKPLKSEDLRLALERVLTPAGPAPLTQLDRSAIEK